MRKIIAAAFALLMLGVATPAVSAETIVKNYTLAIGGGAEDVDTTALIICLGPPEQEYCEEAGIDPIGGYDGRRTDGSGPAYNVVVQIVDDNFADTYTSVCVYSNDHSICDPAAGDVFASGCGTMFLSSPSGITTANPVAGFVYNAVVTSDLAVCLGSTGVGAGNGAALTYF